LPTIDIATIPIFCGASSIDLSSTPIATTNGTLSYWKDAAGTIAMTQTEVENATPNTYYIKSTLANGCYTIQPVLVPDFASCPTGIDPCSCLNNPTSFGASFNGQFSESVTIIGGSEPYQIISGSNISVKPVLPANTTGISPSGYPITVDATNTYQFALDFSTTGWSVAFVDALGFKGKYSSVNTCSYPASACPSATVITTAMIGTGLYNQTLSCIPTDATAPTSSCFIPSTYYEVSTNDIGGDLTLSVENATDNIDVSVWSGDCGTLSLVSCQTDVVGSTIIASNLMPSTTYYIGVGGVKTTTTYDLIFNQTGALPIVLTQFKGKAENNFNLISWVVSSESRLDNYVIEKSNDGINHWTSIGQVQPKGNNGTQQSYNMIDQQPYPITYYRLISTDIDGRSATSRVISIERVEDSFKLLSVYPIPTTESVYVKFNATDRSSYDIILFDVLGNIVKVVKGETTVGVNNVEIILEDISSGVYNLSLRNGAVEYSTKVIKQ
ncbi:MAG: T9SS type A sorting domain-containing protein, partial [Saprospiraceae bacterium]|nr:T9SS type A sorting domain-containing protein [Saprospiraceae bacterium]